MIGAVTGSAIGGAVPERRDVLVLGCGVSALTAARMLARQGMSVAIVDQYPAPGGNHISVAVGDMIFDIGAIHFTGSDNFFDVFPEMRDSCVERHIPAQKLSADLKIRRFPIEASDFRDLSLGTKAAVLVSLLQGRLRRRTPRDAADFMERTVGRVFFERSGLRQYVERLFGVAPERIDSEFGERRLAWLTRRTSLTANLRSLARRFARTASRTSSPARPLSRVRSPEGFGSYYEVALAALARDGVDIRLGHSIRRIARVGGGMSVETDRGTLVADRLVSTMPIRLISSLAGLPPPTLESVDLLSLFVTFEGARRFTGTVLYNFHQGGGWKRLTVFSDLYGTRSGSGYFTVEVPCGRGENDAATAYERFRAHVAEAGLFEGPLRLVGSHRLSDAYPLLDKGCGERRRQALSRLHAAGIESLGRQGAFEYIPHQTVACRDAMAFAEALASRPGVAIASVPATVPARLASDVAAGEDENVASASDLLVAGEPLCTPASAA